MQNHFDIDVDVGVFGRRRAYSTPFDFGRSSKLRAVCVEAVVTSVGVSAFSLASFSSTDGILLTSRRDLKPQIYFKFI